MFAGLNSRIARNFLVFSCLALAPVALADVERASRELIKVPQGENPNMPSDETIFFIPTEANARIGYSGIASSDTDSSHGGAAQGVFILDAGRLGIWVNTTVAGGNVTPDGFAYADGSLRVRKRFPIEINNSKILWVGAGLDVAGRYSQSPGVQSYFRTHLPVAMIGTMFRIGKSDCIVELFAKAAFGLEDSKNEKADWGWGFGSRPVVGGEMLSQCGTIRVVGDYERIISMGDQGSTDRYNLDIKKTWQPNVLKERDWRIGVFGHGELNVEHAPADSLTGLPQIQSTYLSGIELLF